ncbi:hypothetical protein ACFQX4_26415 [Roseomonas sp. GCM10028921]
MECLTLTRATYLEAGGEPAGADKTIACMIASLSRERGAWLWRLSDGWWAMTTPQVADDTDPFEAAP